MASLLGKQNRCRSFGQRLRTGRYLPFARETSRNRKANERNLDRHILPHLGAYRLNGINQRDLRGILGHYKPETLALVRNNSIENNSRLQYAGDIK